MIFPARNMYFPDSSGPQVLELTIPIELANLDRFNEALEEARHQLGI
jgi:hypothetical protein